MAVRRLPGDIFAVEFDKGHYTIARVLNGALVEFYDLDIAESDLDDIDAKVLEGMPVLFRINVMDRAFGPSGWKLRGHTDLTDSEDRLVGKFSNRTQSKGR